MRCRHLKSTIIGLLVLLAIAGLGASRANAADPIHVTFLHFNDVYELLPEAGKGGLAEAATIVRNQRARNYNTIVTFGGDLLSPSSMSGLTRGSQMIDMLNGIGVDYATLGNHEFDFGPTVLRQRMAESQFTWLVTSVSEDDGTPFGGANTTAIRRIGPITIGFFSVLSTDTATRSNPGPHVHFLAPIMAASEAVKALRDHSVDVVVALTHEPVAADKALIDQVPGIDLVLGGDDHEPMMVQENGVSIVKAGHDAEFLAVVDLTAEKHDGKVTLSVASHLVPTLGAKPNAKLMEKIAGYNDEVATQLSQHIATLDSELDSRTDMVRGAESTMGDVIAEALRQGTGADLAIINGGGIRGDKVYAAGSELIRKDIQSELPFANMAVVIELTGQQIQAALENGVSQVQDKAGRFPQVAGLAFSFNPKRPVGKRIVNVTIAGAALDLKKTYKVATNDYMSNGGDGYSMMTKAKRIDGAGEKLLTDIVADYLSAKGKITQQPDGRIRQVQ
jgi:2',3'-cyclic-nucleotide 2'-phosphodiesterase (5'-nucleotidase family)